MEATTIHKGFKFINLFSTPYAEVLYCAPLQLIICSATAEYIPIEEFKVLFNNMLQHIKEHPAKHLIFDKRALRTFHQPSMEWYFAEWKPLARETGLTHHYKILPAEDWFVKSVEAGKALIYEKYGRDFLHGIDITYVDDVESVVAGIATH